MSALVNCQHSLFPLPPGCPPPQLRSRSSGVLPPPLHCSSSRDPLTPFLLLRPQLRQQYSHVSFTSSSLCATRDLPHHHSCGTRDPPHHHSCAPPRRRAMVPPWPRPPASGKVFEPARCHMEAGAGIFSPIWTHGATVERGVEAFYSVRTRGGTGRVG
jgi:hypothetical protein